MQDNGRSENRLQIEEAAPPANNQPPPQQAEPNAPRRQRIRVRDFFGLIPTPENLIYIEENRVLLMSGKMEMINPSKQSLYFTLKSNFCPNMVWYSLSTLLVIACTGLFIYGAASGFKGDTTFVEINQAKLTQLGANKAYLVYRGQVYRLVVSLFLHINMIHLIANALAIMTIVSKLQYTFGWWRTLLVYLACGIVGNMFSDLVSVDAANSIAKIGASIPIYGLLGVGLGYFLINWSALSMIGPIFKFRSIIIILLAIVFMVMFTDQSDSVDYLGHVGGIVSGFFISGLLPSLKFGCREIVIRLILSTLFIGMTLSCFLVFYLAPQSEYSY